VASPVGDSDEDGFYLGGRGLRARVASGDDAMLPTLIGGGVLVLALILGAIALLTGSRIGDEGDTSADASPTTVREVTTGGDSSDATDFTATTDKAPATSTVAATVTAGGGTPSATKPSAFLRAAKRVKTKAVLGESTSTTLPGPISWLIPTLPPSQQPQPNSPTTTRPQSTTRPPSPRHPSTTPPTRPPTTSPPATSPPVTSPPSTEPPTTEPPTTEPPTTEPPTTEPPTTEPPTDPPVTTETTAVPPEEPTTTTTTPDDGGGGGLLDDPLCTVLGLLGAC
jgi:hypothetical protein